MRPRHTLLCIPRLLTHDGYRERVVRRVRDPVVLAYWRQQFGSYDDDFRTQIIAPILNKLDAVLSAPELRNILGQPKSTIDLRKIMDEGRILIVNMQKGTARGEQRPPSRRAFSSPRSPKTRSGVPTRRT